MTVDASKPKIGDALVGHGHSTDQSVPRCAAEGVGGDAGGDARRTGGDLSRNAGAGAVGVHRREGGGAPARPDRPGACFKLIGEEEAERLKAIPTVQGRATRSPSRWPSHSRCRRSTGCASSPGARSARCWRWRANIREFIKKYAAGDVNVDAFLTVAGGSDVEVVEREAVDEGPATDLDKMVAGSPIINLVNVALLTAVKDKASDIHIEPDKKGTRIRYRIDGVLRDLMKPPPGMHAAIVSRVKVIGKMDIAEKRLPQEGRVRIVAEGREIDLRVSSMPTLLGEKLVIRILDKANLQGARWRTWASASESLAVVQAHAAPAARPGAGDRPDRQRQDDDALLGAGPAPQPELNIVTVEDPVEYQLDLINQIQVQDDDRADLRQRAAQHPAAGPGRDHGRRDPRRGDRADRGAGRADRPPRARDAAHQRFPSSAAAATSAAGRHEQYLLVEEVT